MSLNSNIKFLGVDSTKVNLTEKKDATNNAVTQYYTAEEISGSSVKVYRGLITQLNTSAPTAVVLENNLGTITFQRNSIGSYSVISSGLFLVNKTYYPTYISDNSGGKYFVYRSNDNQIEITQDTETPSDNGLFNTPFEILIYP